MDLRDIEFIYKRKSCINLIYTTIIYSAAVVYFEIRFCKYSPSSSLDGKFRKPMSGIAISSKSIYLLDSLGTAGVSGSLRPFSFAGHRQLKLQFLGTKPCGNFASDQC